VYRSIALIFMLALVGAAPAQVTSSPTASKPVASKEEKLRQYFKLQQQLHKLFQDKQYDKAAEVCRELIRFAPDQPDGHYNLACALARQGQKKEALAALREAVKRGWLDSRHTLRDADLAGLRMEQAFGDLIKEMEAKEVTAFEGKEVSGVRTIRGLPDDGLRYRLRMSPTAAKAKPSRLIVWMHPSGGSMNEAIEAMAPMFIRHGFALLVFTQKNFMGWEEEDGPRLERTLKVVSALEGIEGHKPLLMGFSAGGQMALALWRQNPDAYGGLILDAAYPLDFSRPPGEMTLLPAPKEKPAKDMPMFVLVGEQDGGAPVWRKAEKEWGAAGLPLTVHYIPGKGHGWLFDAAQTDALEKWLEGLGKGP
jgi:predicted esterase